MDPIGLAASLVTLLEVVGVACKLCNRIQHAPEELSRVTSQLSVIHAELHLLKELEESSLSTSTWYQSQDVRIKLSQSLGSARQTIFAINDACDRYTRQNKFGFRVYWAFLGRATVNELLNDLRKSECSLTVVLNLLSLHLSHRAQASLAEVGANVSRIQQEMASMKNIMVSCAAPQMSSIIGTKVAESIGYQPSGQASKQVVRHTKTRHISNSYLYDLFGFCGTMSSMWNDEQTTYSLSLRLRLPLQRIFIADIALRTHTFTWPSFSILGGGGLAVKRLVPEDAKVMKACSAGDIFAIMDLFRKREASPNDVTVDNLTPMFFAIESGNSEAVELLIRQGADVNWTFGQNQTSPLAWALGKRQLDIARLLISYDASLDHVSAYGWSPLFYLWLETEVQPCSAVEYLNLLSARPDFKFCHAGLSDINGWGIMHRVVAFGTPDEVATLLRLGANPFELVGPLQWSAIHHAVFYGRYDNFLELLPYYKHLDIDTPDERGWTLLHIAASEGHDSICKHLLSLGADWQRKSWEFSSRFSYHIPDSLHGGCWTPAEAARAESTERYEKFIAVVEASRRKGNTQGAILDEPDLWFDAPEALIFGSQSVDYAS